MRFSRFREKAEAEGLTVKDCGNGHWQVNGPLVVNYYPFAKKGASMYINGAHKGVRYGVSEDDVIRAAKSPPKHQPKESRANRSNSVSRKKRMLKKNPHCHWCGKAMKFTEATVDHVIPISRGGSNRSNNVVLSCVKCNQERGDNMPELQKRESSK